MVRRQVVFLSLCFSLLFVPSTETGLEHGVSFHHRRWNLAVSGTDSAKIRALRGGSSDLEDISDDGELEEGFDSVEVDSQSTMNACIEIEYV